jgi:UDP-glucose 4-epimerase
MRVLITGGAGFIGSHLADRLLADGHQVLILDNLTTGRRGNVPEGATFIEANVEWEGPLERLTGYHPDVIVHAAASYKDPDAWLRDTRTNVAGTVRLLDYARAAGCNRLIYFQTALCYGTRPDEQPVTLDHPLRPDSSYAISKTAGEQYIANSGLDYVSFRLANCYGPRNLSGPVPTFYKRLAAGESCYVADTRRDFVYVGDLVELVTRAVDGTGRGVYHASSGTDHAIADLYAAVAEAMGVGPDDPEVQPRSPDDAATILLDPSRTRHEFNWWPATPLDAGVFDAVGWYRDNGVGETYTHLKIAT